MNIQYFVEAKTYYPHVLAVSKLHIQIIEKMLKDMLPVVFYLIYHS